MEAHKPLNFYGSLPGVHPLCGSGEAREFAQCDKNFEFGYKASHFVGQGGEAERWQRLNG